MSVKPEKEGAWRAFVANLPTSGRELELVASEEERRKIARDFNLVDLAKLEVTGRLMPAAGGSVRVNGRIAAELTQTCVVSLRPVEETIDEEFARYFVPGDLTETEQAEVVVSLSEEEEPEPFDGVSINLRDVALEQFALALNPYPRHPDAVQEAVREEAEGEEKESAFAALKTLKTAPPPRKK